MPSATVNAEYVGQDTADNKPTATQIDLRTVTFGRGTFENPCFWLLLGVVGTITVQYMMKRSR